MKYGRAQKLIGGFEQGAFVHTMKKMFSEESEYGVAFKNRQSAYDPNRLELNKSICVRLLRQCEHAYLSMHGYV